MPLPAEQSMKVRICPSSPARPTVARCAEGFPVRIYHPVAETDLPTKRSIVVVVSRSVTS